MEDFIHNAGIVQARLRAVVSVDEKFKVQCQQVGCGHSIYAAIHVVEEDGRLLVLGSTCFAKRYGTAHALGHAQYGEGGGGGGRKLTEEERQMLIQNTAALLSRFEAQAAAEAKAVAILEEKKRAEALAHKQQMVDKLHKLRAAYEDQQIKGTRQTGTPGLGTRKLSPWPWQKEPSSVALFTAPGGEHWVRVEHRDGSQKLVPWPEFPGWESFLPTGVGVPDATIGAIAVNDIVEAIQILKKHRYKGPAVGRWQDVLPRRISR